MCYCCRSLDFYWRRGGNASNSSTVLSLLGADVELFGTLPKDQKPELEYVLRTFFTPLPWFSQSIWCLAIIKEIIFSISMEMRRNYKVINFIIYMEPK